MFTVLIPTKDREKKFLKNNRSRSMEGVQTWIVNGSQVEYDLASVANVRQFSYPEETIRSRLTLGLNSLSLESSGHVMMMSDDDFLSVGESSDLKFVGTTRRKIILVPRIYYVRGKEVVPCENQLRYEFLQSLPCVSLFTAITRSNINLWSAVFEVPWLQAFFERVPDELWSQSQLFERYMALTLFLHGFQPRVSSKMLLVRDKSDRSAPRRESLSADAYIELIHQMRRGLLDTEVGLGLVKSAGTEISSYLDSLETLTKHEGAVHIKRQMRRVQLPWPLNASIGRVFRLARRRTLDRQLLTSCYVEIGQ